MGRIVFITRCRKCRGCGVMNCPSCGGDGYDFLGGQCHNCYGTSEVTCDACGGSGEIERNDD